MAETVKVHVHHGPYTAEFVGEGDTLEEAVAAAASQSSYSDGILPDGWGQFWGFRSGMYATLLSSLRDGEEYSGFGWCTFSRVPRCCDGTGWTGDWKNRCAEHFDPASAIFAPRAT